jgi:hypothetical protein
MPIRVLVNSNLTLALVCQVKKSKIENLLNQYKTCQKDTRLLLRDVVRVYIYKEDSYVSSGDIHSKKIRHTIHIIVNFLWFLIIRDGFYQESDEKYT